MKFSSFKILIPVVFFVGIFFLLNLTGLSQAVKGVFYAFASPLQSFFWKTGDNASDFGGGIFEFGNIKQKNEQLQEKNKELLAEILLLREVKNENDFLRKTMDIGLNKEFNLLLANIVAKDISRDSILINRGFKDGVKKNQPALTSQKTLLGKVGKVYENFSEVILISNSEISFDVKVSDIGVFAVAKGRGRSEINLEFVPKDKELKSGNFIISAALGGIFPEGLLVGEIKEIKKSDTEPFQSASIKPAFDIADLDKIFIIENFE